MKCPFADNTTGNSCSSRLVYDHTAAAVGLDHQHARIVQAVIRLVVARPHLVEMADMDDHSQSRHPRVETQSKKSIKRLKQMRSTILCFPLSPFPHLCAGFQKSPLCIVTSLASFDHHIYRASYFLTNENIRAATRSITSCTILGMLSVATRRKAYL
jgi:hypothetical protein